MGAQGVRAQAPPGAVGAPQPRQDRPDQRPPSAVAAENYDPKGMPIGSFRLFPELELDEVYNDNIYATAKGQPGLLASFIQLIKPSAELRSDWNNHMLNFFARGNFGIYTASSLENFQDFSLGTTGRLDIQRDWNVYGGGSFSRAHEDRGTPNSTSNASVPPNMYNQIATNAGYYQKFNRFSARLDGRLDNYNYINQGAGPAAGTIFNSDRNRTETREALRLGYEFSPGYTVWSRGSLNQRTYQNTPDSLGFYRTNWGYDVVGGVQVDLGGITSFEAFVGYLQQYYVDNRFPTVSSVNFGLVGYWNPYRPLMIKPYVRRGVEDSALTTAAAYLSTSIGLDVDYQLRPNIKLTAHGDNAWTDYSQIAGNTYEQDQYLTLRGAVTYNLTPNLFTGLQYQWTHKTSNLPNAAYDQSVVMLRLGARL